MYQRRRVAFCPLPDPALSTILTGLIAVDECVQAGSEMGENHIPDDECVLRHTISGQTAMRWAEDSYAIGPAGIDVYGAGLRYHQTVGRRPWATRYLVLRGPWAAPLLARIRSGPVPVRRIEAAESPLPGLIDETVALALDQPPGWEWRCAARLAVILDEVLETHDRSRAAGLPAAVAALLDARPDQPCSSSAIARALGMSLRSLTHRFSAEAGRPLAQWVRARRLERARLLLRQGLSVVAVAGRMGFSSPFQLSRAYRAWSGHPPSLDIGHLPDHPVLTRR